MPFQTVCPGCQASYQIADQFRGRLLRCKKCQQTFTAEPTAAAGPARPASAPEARKPAPPSGVTARPIQRDEPRAPRPRQKRARPQAAANSALPWIIGGAAAGLLVVTLVGGLGAWLLLGSRDQARSTPAAVNSPAAPALVVEAPPAPVPPVKDAVIPVPAAQPIAAPAPPRPPSSRRPRRGRGASSRPRR